MGSEFPNLKEEKYGHNNNAHSLAPKSVKIQKKILQDFEHFL